MALLGDLSKAKTIRIILINPQIIGDAEIRIDFDVANSVTRTYDVLTHYTEPNSNIIIDHIRGALLDGKTQDVAYQLIQNTGGCALDAVYLELVDGVRYAPRDDSADGSDASRSLPR